MSPKLPVVSGEELNSRVAEIWLYLRASKGQPRSLEERNATDPERQAVTVPLHDEIALGTLRRILRDAKISSEQFVSVL
jgi:predicted RNA binding protein YcfA (HicA-like mRNA interferase family)